MRFFFLALLFLTPQLHVVADDVYKLIDETRRAKLKNLDEICGVTVVLHGDFNEYQRQCVTEFELRIRQVGIKIKTDGGGPLLLFSCSPQRLQGSLFETVFVKRGSGFISLNEETWAASANTSGRRPANLSRTGQRASLDLMLNEFLNDYLASR